MVENSPGFQFKDTKPDTNESYINSFPKEGVICDFTQQFPPMLTTTEVQETQDGNVRITMSDGSHADISPETQKILQDSNVSFSTVETMLWIYLNERNKSNFINLI